MDEAERLLQRVDERTALLKQLVEDHVEDHKTLGAQVQRDTERIDALYRDDYATIRRLCAEDSARNEDAIQDLREALTRAEGALAMLKVIGVVLAALARGLAALWRG